MRNVRELEHTIERAVILPRGEHITPEELPPTIRAIKGESEEGLPLETPVPVGLTLKEVERELIRQTLAHTGSKPYPSPGRRTPCGPDFRCATRVPRPFATCLLEVLGRSGVTLCLRGENFDNLRRLTWHAAGDSSVDVLERHFRQRPRRGEATPALLRRRSGDPASGRRGTTEPRDRRINRAGLRRFPRSSGCECPAERSKPVNRARRPEPAVRHPAGRRLRAGRRA